METTPVTTMTGAAASPTVLDALDEALVGLRRAQQHPAFRHRLLEGLSHDVELGTLRLLRAVQRDEDDPTIGKVAEVLVIDPSTASRVVDRAVTADFLRRRPCAQDGRRSRLQLTPAGEKLLEDVNRRRREVLAEVTSSWNPVDVRQLVVLLRTLVTELDGLESST